MKTDALSVFTGTLITGEEVRLRAIVPDDLEEMRRLFKTFSPETVFHRFQEPIPEMTVDRALRYVEFDRNLVCAVAAFYSGLDGHDVFIGVARFGIIRPGEAEFAIVVGDPWHRQGIGTLLMRAITAVAADNGIDWFETTFDTCNAGFLNFCANSGFRGELAWERNQLRMRTAIRIIGRPG